MNECIINETVFCFCFWIKFRVHVITSNVCTTSKVSRTNGRLKTNGIEKLVCIFMFRGRVVYRSHLFVSTEATERCSQSKGKVHQQNRLVSITRSSFAFPYHFISYRYILCHIIPYHVWCYPILSFYILSMSYRIMTYRITSHHIIAYHVISYSYNILWYHVISYHSIWLAHPINHITSYVPTKRDTTWSSCYIGVVAALL